MKICFICPEYPPGPHGGIGTYTYSAAKELSLRNHIVRIIGVYPKHYPGPDYEKDGNITIWRLRERSGKFGWIIPWIKQHYIIKRWAEEKEIDLVEAPDSRGWFAFWGKLPIPTILRFHGSQTYIAYILRRKPNRFTKLLESLSYKRADACISVSEFNAKTTARLSKLSKPIEVIYNGIEIIDASPTQRTESCIIFAGTLVEYKGILDFLNALVLLAIEGNTFKAKIYGKDAYIGENKTSQLIQIYANKPILQGKLQYCGNVTREELFDQYKFASVAVFPSHVESFGLTPIEAMMCECPVIFTNNTTGPEIIENLVDGLLIPTKNPYEIKEAIKFVINNPKEAVEIGRKARQKVISLFNIKNQISKNLEFYNKIVCNKGSNQ